MKKQRMISLAVCFCLSLSALAGCGEQAKSVEVKSPYAEVISMETTPVIDYTVPVYMPNILVDLQGYCRGEKQYAFLKGKTIPEEFSLVRAESGEVVYTGAVEDTVYHEDLGLYSGCADFSEFTEAGSYYLQCDTIGQSYSFQIEEELYDRLFEETYDVLMAKCSERTLESAEAVALLETFEWYGKLFPDEDGDKIPDMLAALKGWISYQESNGIQPADEALYAALLAKFSYTYQKYDLKYATECLQRASTVFGQVQNTLSKDADTFFALTELYRATGLATYRNQIADYVSFFENNTSYVEEQEYLYGVMTYLVTRQSVNMDLCSDFMGTLMDKAEEISGRYEEMLRPVNAKNNGSADLLKNAMIVSCANYCMNNYQYTNICEEFLHYLMGRNQESVNFYVNEEERIRYLLLLAGLAADAE